MTALTSMLTLKMLGARSSVRVSIM